MQAFLIIASLSLAFYLGLLVVLYRDGRKRRSSRASVHRLQAGSTTELGPLPTMVYTGPADGGAATVLVRFAPRSGHGKLKSRGVRDKAAEVITIPTLTRDNDNAQYG